MGCEFGDLSYEVQRDVWRNSHDCQLDLEPHHRKTLPISNVGNRDIIVDIPNM